MGKIICTETTLKGCYVIETMAAIDNRGIFSRLYEEEVFAEKISTKKLVQVNHSVNFKKGTLRGLHYQLPPYSEDKLIRCLRGSILDVVVDLRKNSPSFLKWFSVELSRNNNRMIWIPEGCAHGFITLESDSELIYFHTAPYHPGSERGIHYQDGYLAIDWHIPVELISDRDKSLPFLSKDFSGIEL